MKLTNLETRRSVREYTDQAIPSEILNDILNSAQYVPTAMNTQPFKMIVVKRSQFDNETLFKMTNQKHALTADYNVFIYSLKKEAMTVEWMKKYLYYLPEDRIESTAKMVIESFKANTNLESAAHSVAFAMALEADAQGIGSTIYTGFNQAIVDETFKGDISSDYEPIIAISLGYRSPNAVIYPKKIKPLSEFVIFKK